LESRLLHCQKWKGYF